MVNEDVVAEEFLDELVKRTGKDKDNSDPNINFVHQTVKGNENTTSLQGLFNDINLDLVNHGQVYLN